MFARYSPRYRQMRLVIHILLDASRTQTVYIARLHKTRETIKYLDQVSIYTASLDYKIPGSYEHSIRSMTSKYS